jgi:hypothetical protein
VAIWKPADGPFWRNPWWGQTHDRINIAIIVALLLFMLWKSFP